MLALSLSLLKNFLEHLEHDRHHRPLADVLRSMSVYTTFDLSSAPSSHSALLRLDRLSTSQALARINSEMCSWRICSTAQQLLWDVVHDFLHFLHNLELHMSHEGPLTHSSLWNQPQYLGVLWQNQRHWHVDNLFEDELHDGSWEVNWIISTRSPTCGTDDAFMDALLTSCLASTMSSLV